jgi:riboflavin synthase
MFTGIVSDIGVLLKRDGGKFRIGCHYPPSSIVLGASTACDGCCLTITGLDETTDGAAFKVDVSNETLARTTLYSWQQGARVNLERPLALGDELGGHLVTGHVDGLALIRQRSPDGDSVRFLLEAPTELAKFIASKGSVALNGVSLTVNEVDGRAFGVNIVPYTLTHTTWGDLEAGDLVNLEVDLLARYVERIATGRIAAGALASRQDY